MSVRVRILSIGVSIAVVGLSVFAGAGPAQALSPNVPFADAALKQCVIEALSSTEPEVTLEQLQSLTELDCENRRIVDVTPLAQATSLLGLRLSRNEITDLPSLSSLTVLKTLELSQNELTDLSGLSGLSGLLNLDVRYNRLQGIAVLRGLGRLQIVDASYNSITSLGDLSTLGDLDALNVSHNSIANATAFAGGAVLRSANLSFNLLADVQFASRLGQLDSLDLSYNEIMTAVPVARLKAEVSLQHQSIALPSVIVDTTAAVPIVRGATLDAIPVQLANDSQAYGYPAPQGFTWRSSGVGQLLWADNRTGPTGNPISFGGRFVQSVTRGALTAPTPTITGSPIFLQKLTAVPGAWGPAPVSLSYQWKRNGVNIAAATGSTYTLTADDIGSRVSVVVAGARASYTSASRESASTAIVTGAALTATPVPTISGSAKVGQTLVAAAGAWAPLPVVLAHQWNRNGVPIGGATATSYALTNADAGATITVTVTGSKAGYSAVAKTSAPTSKVTGGIITPASPQITGVLALGSVLTAVPGDWAPAPVSYSFHWKRNGVFIPGAIGAAYTATAADLGTSITVAVDGNRSGYTLVVRTSPPASRPK